MNEIHHPTRQFPLEHNRVTHPFAEAALGFQLLQKAGIRHAILLSFGPRDKCQGTTLVVP
jgi:hypothetical protein